METLLQVVILVLGGICIVFLFGGAVFNLYLALSAYMRYHLLGERTPMIDDLFYRCETTPPPSRLKGIAPVLFIAFVLWSVFYS